MRTSRAVAVSEHHASRSPYYMRSLVQYCSAPLTVSQ